MQLDDYDIRLLRAIQVDADRTVQELADLVRRLAAKT